MGIKQITIYTCDKCGTTLPNKDELYYVIFKCENGFEYMKYYCQHCMDKLSNEWIYRGDDEND